MRVDLVGTVQPAGGSGGPGRLVDQPCPIDRLASELRSLVPGWSFGVHTYSAAPGLGGAAGRVEEREPIGLARACALGAPLAELLQQRWRRERPDLVHADCFVSGLAALRAARPLEIPVVVARRSAAPDPWERPATPAPDVDLRLAWCATHLLARDEEDRARLHRHATGRRVSWLPAALEGARGAPARPGRRVAGRLVSVLDPSAVPVIADVLAVADPFWGHRELLLIAPLHAPTAARPSPIEARGGRLVAPSWLGGKLTHLLDPVLDVLERATARGVRVLVAPGGQRAARSELLRTSSVFVFTPEHPPTDRAVVEAMSAGCLVVSSGTGPLAGLVEDGVTGFVTAGGGRAGLASALTAGSHPDVVATLGGRAAAVAAERYAWAAVAVLARDVYKTVVAGGG